MDKTTPYYRIQAGTSKKTVLILVEQPTESIVKMGAYKSKMFDDINKHVKTHLPKIQTYFTFAIHKHVEKIKIADIRADMHILSKTISAVF